MQTSINNNASSTLMEGLMGKDKDESGLPRCLSGKEPACQWRRPGSVPAPERSPGGGNSNPFQYSCLENPVNRGAWFTVHGVAEESEMTD